jgi:hypothetical protein
MDSIPTRLTAQLADEQLAQSLVSLMLAAQQIGHVSVAELLLQALEELATLSPRRACLDEALLSLLYHAPEPRQPDVRLD